MPVAALLESEPIGGENSSPIVHRPRGPTDCPEHVSLTFVNGPLGAVVAPIVTVAVRLLFVMTTGLDGPLVPAVCSGKTTRDGPFTETTVPLPDRLISAGDAPLYETDKGPDTSPGVGGENSTITAQFLFTGTV